MIVTAPFLSLGLLAGMVAEKQTFLTPEDAEPYHARAKAAIESFPYSIPPSFQWTGSDVAEDPRVQAAVIKLLRPNVILRREYVENVPGVPVQYSRRAHLLIVQCRDSRDMLGHYPPRCYVGHGMTMDSEKDRNWEVGDMLIRGKEYQFSQNDGDNVYRQIVYNFMIVPGVGIVRDMQGISDAAEDYQQRFYGAAQFQIVMDGDMPVNERDEILRTLLGADPSIIKTVEQIQ
jgi:hypothetical protein